MVKPYINSFICTCTSVNSHNHLRKTSYRWKKNWGSKRWICYGHTKISGRATLCTHPTTLGPLRRPVPSHSPTPGPDPLQRRPAGVERHHTPRWAGGSDRRCGTAPAHASHSGLAPRTRDGGVAPAPLSEGLHAKLNVLLSLFWNS